MRAIQEVLRGERKLVYGDTEIALELSGFNAKAREKERLSKNKEELEAKIGELEDDISHYEREIDDLKNKIAEAEVDKHELEKLLRQ